uniref:Uncharacterized protein n=1 Tax=Anopheles albimanus TaxID=7167 RepID=A0A182FX77_ANOAL
MPLQYRISYHIQRALNPNTPKSTRPKRMSTNAFKKEPEPCVLDSKKHARWISYSRITGLVALVVISNIMPDQFLYDSLCFILW